MVELELINRNTVAVDRWLSIHTTSYLVKDLTRTPDGYRRRLEIKINVCWSQVHGCHDST